MVSNKGNEKSNIYIISDIYIVSVKKGGKCYRMRIAGGRMPLGGELLNMEYLKCQILAFAVIFRLLKVSPTIPLHLIARTRKPPQF